MTNQFDKRLLPTALIGAVLGSTAIPAWAQTAADTGGAIVLDEITLQGQQGRQAETEYVAPTSINRSDAEPIDTPQTITAVTAARIEEQDIRSDLDLFNAAPGVDATIREGFLTVRGFGGSRAINGVPVDTFVGRTSADLTAFEQIEVLKGPAALFTGQGGFGGMVNYSFKRPLDTEHFKTILGFGDPSSKRLMFDYNSTPMLNDRLRWRLVGSYEDQDSNRYPETYERTSLFGTVEFDLTDQTLVRLNGWRQRNDQIRDFRQGLPAYSDGTLIDFPVDTTAVQDWTLFPFRSDWVTVDLEHRFNDRWKAKLTYMNGESYHPAEHSIPFGCSGPLAVYDYTLTGIDRDNPDGRQCHTLSYWNDWNQYEIFDASLNGAFDAFGRTHDVIFGATQQRSWFRRQFGSSDASSDFIVDIFNPDHHVIDKPSYTFTRPFSAKPSPDNDYQVFAQVNLRATDKLSFPIAGRWSWSRTGDGEWIAKNEFTPSLAAVYEANENLTFYGQYAQMFTANSYYRSWNPDWTPGGSYALEDGILLPNQTGTQKEIGVKARVFDGQALATASIFDITRKNTARDDPDPTHLDSTGYPFYVSTGEQRSRGIELSLSGKIRPGWTIGAGYAYTDATYTKDDHAQGADLGTARHSGNIWTSYEFQPGRFDGLSLGAGIDFRSSFKGSATDADDTNRVVAPGYGIVNARVAYDINDKVTASLNVDNLFNRKYYAEVGDVGAENYYGETRRISFNLHSRF